MSRVVAIELRLRNTAPFANRQGEREDALGQFVEQNELVVAMSIADRPRSKDGALDPGASEPGEVGYRGHPVEHRRLVGDGFGGAAEHTEQGVIRTRFRRREGDT